MEYSERNISKPMATTGLKNKLNFITRIQIISDRISKEEKYKCKINQTDPSYEVCCNNSPNEKVADRSDDFSNQVY